MTDLSLTIAPRSDQLNADDLIGGPRTIKVTRVSKKDGDQPIAINFEGDGGKPYKPCLSMRRVLVRLWGIDGTAYAGKRMTLFRDDNVQFGGTAVGGIRISHVSGIDKAVTMPLTDKRGSRRPYTVKPLAEERSPAPSLPPPDGGNRLPEQRQQPSARERLFAAAREAAAKGNAALNAFREALDPRADEALGPILPELDRTACNADAADDDFPGFAPAHEEA